MTRRSLLRRASLLAAVPLVPTAWLLREWQAAGLQAELDAELAALARAVRQMGRAQDELREAAERMLPKLRRLGLARNPPTPPRVPTEWPTS